MVAITFDKFLSRKKLHETNKTVLMEIQRITPQTKTSKDNLPYTDYLLEMVGGDGDFEGDFKMTIFKKHFLDVFKHWKLTDTDELINKKVLISTKQDGKYIDFVVKPYD